MYCSEITKLQVHIYISMHTILPNLCFIGKFLPLKTMLGPRYDDQVAEENRFHPSMLSNYLKSLKVKSNFLFIEMLLLLLTFIQILLFRFKKNVVDGFLGDTYTEKFSIYA